MVGHYDVQNPAAIEILGWHFMPWDALDMTSVGGLAYAANSCGIDILDLRDCPTCYGDFDTDGNVDSDDVAEFVFRFLDTIGDNADLDHDCDEDIDDISVIVSSFLTGCG